MGPGGARDRCEARLKARAEIQREYHAIAKLRYVAFSVPDPKKSAKFYGDAFGMRLVCGANSATATGVYLTHAFGLARRKKIAASASPLSTNSPTFDQSCL